MALNFFSLIEILQMMPTLIFLALERKCATPDSVVGKGAIQIIRDTFLAHFCPPPPPRVTLFSFLITKFELKFL